MVQAGSGRLEGFNVSWLGDKLLYDNRAGEIFVADADGRDAHKISPAGQVAAALDGCADGKHLLYARVTDAGLSLWRLDADGGNPRQLTHDRTNQSVSCSPDGKWAAYSSVDSGSLKQYRVSLDGGEPAQISFDNETTIGGTAISPDGKLLAYPTLEGEGIPKNVGVVRAVDGGKVVAKGLLPNGMGQGRWSHDSKGFDFVLTRNGVGNIYHLPMGAPPDKMKQITNFKEGRIYSFAWSPDGKKLAVGRGPQTRDVVLISNFRQ
jgi:Tol biopolymer transport system component